MTAYTERRMDNAAFLAHLDGLIAGVEERLNKRLDDFQKDFKEELTALRHGLKERAAWEKQMEVFRTETMARHRLENWVWGITAPLLAAGLAFLIWGLLTNRIDIVEHAIISPTPIVVTATPTATPYIVVLTPVTP